MILNFFQAIPDVQTTINMMIAEGDLVFVYSTYTGTHTGNGLLGFQGASAPWLDSYVGGTLE